MIMVQIMITFLILSATSIAITVICLHVMMPKIINFPFVPNGKFIILGLPKFRQITVYFACE